MDSDQCQRWEKFFLHGREPILFVCNGMITDVNPALLGLLGYHREEEELLCGVPLSEVITSDVPSKERSLDADRVTCRHKSGRLITAYLKATPLSEEESVLSLSPVAEQAQGSLSLYQTILKEAVDSIIVIDAQGVIIDTNGAIASMFGYSSDELLGKNVSCLMPQSYGQQHDMFLQSYLHAGTAKIVGIGRDTIALRKDGAVLDVHIAITEVYIYGRRCFCGFVRDIGKLKEAEKLVVKAKEEAEKANVAKTNFLSNVSHEVRTPLNAIIGLSELIRLEDNLNEQQAKDVAQIEKAGKHLLALISDIVDLSRIEAGRLDLCMGSVALDQLLQECISLVAGIARSKQIRFMYNESIAKGLLVVADYLRLKQVVVNLLSNAIKYNRMGGIVELQLHAQNNSTIRLVVRDTGYGISGENQIKLFQPFNRLGMENTDIEGTGIGLVISRNIIEQMGGVLGFESQQDIGSCFWIDVKIAFQEDTTINRRVFLF